MAPCKYQIPMKVSFSGFSTEERGWAFVWWDLWIGDLIDNLQKIKPSTSFFPIFYSPSHSLILRPNIFSSICSSERKKKTASHRQCKQSSRVSTAVYGQLELTGEKAGEIKCKKAVSYCRLEAYFVLKSSPCGILIASGDSDAGFGSPLTDLMFLHIIAWYFIELETDMCF